MGDGGSRRRPGEPRAEPAEPARQAAAHQPDARGLDLADRRLRAAQPVAVLVRPRERQPLDRRRRPGRVGGGRLPHRRAASARSRTTAGAATRARRSSTPASRSRARATRSSRCSSYSHVGRAARSPAATSTAARRCRPRSGRYFYGDFCSGTIWSFRPATARRSAPRASRQDRRLSSFGEDGNGELYAVSLTAGRSTSSR